MVWIVFPVFGHLGPEWLDARGPRLVAKQALEPLFHQAFLPAPDASLGLAGSQHNFVRAGSVGGEEDDPRAPDVFMGTATTASRCLRSMKFKSIADCPLM